MMLSSQSLFQSFDDRFNSAARSILYVVLVLLPAVGPTLTSVTVAKDDSDETEAANAASLLRFGKYFDVMVWETGPRGTRCGDVNEGADEVDRARRIPRVRCCRVTAIFSVSNVSTVESKRPLLQESSRERSSVRRVNILLTVCLQNTGLEGFLCG